MTSCALSSQTLSVTYIQHHNYAADPLGLLQQRGLVPTFFFASVHSKRTSPAPTRATIWYPAPQAAEVRFFACSWALGLGHSPGQWSQQEWQL